MTQDSIKRPSIEELLQRGLDLYGQNRTAEAIRCWREVLSIAPGEQRALDYLQSAGVTPTPLPLPPLQPQFGKVIELSSVREQRLSSQDGAASSPKPFAPEGPVSGPLPDLDDLGGKAVDRGALERLLREKRYEEALVFLYKERERTPQDASITRGIQTLKDYLAARYSRELGSLDQIPEVIAPPEVRQHLPAEKREMLRLIDGIATFGDVLLSSRFGRFETCRMLALMLKHGVIGVRSSPAEPVTMGETPKPPAQPVTMGEPPKPPAQPEPPPEPPSTTRKAQEPASVGPHVEHADPYAELFASATEAYLRRDYDEALRLFEACVQQRPHDRRAEYNLRKLKERKGSP